MNNTLDSLGGKTALRATKQNRRSFLRQSLPLASLLPATRLWPQSAKTEPVDQVADLVLANHILAAHQIFDAYGHVSSRSSTNPQRYFMSRSLAPELVQHEDVLEYDLDSNVVGDPKPALFLERFIHGEIYKARPDVNAVIHCHTSSLIPFGATNVPLKAVFGLAGFLADGVPVFDTRKNFGMTDLLIKDATRARALAQTLGSSPVALMRGHGAVVVGPTVPVAVGRCVYLDMDARVQQQSIALGGKVTYLTPEEGKQSVADDYRRAWELWKREASR
jgi:HCOMODA/2-hydroxy-3-carboxy-muconic semialdehyde decarboxylase